MENVGLSLSFCKHLNIKSRLKLKNSIFQELSRQWCKEFLIKTSKTNKMLLIQVFFGSKEIKIFTLCIKEDFHLELVKEVLNPMIFKIWDLLKLHFLLIQKLTLLIKMFSTLVFK
jgi:hypothetical protein